MGGEELSGAFSKNFKELEKHSRNTSNKIPMLPQALWVGPNTQPAATHQSMAGHPEASEAKRRPSRRPGQRKPRQCAGCHCGWLHGGCASKLANVGRRCRRLSGGYRAREAVPWPSLAGQLREARMLGGERASGDWAGL